MSGAQTLAEQTADKGELAVLVDGPWRGAWYWRADLEAQQAAARAMHAAGGAAELGDKCHYRPTEQWVPNPLEPEVSGRAWTYHPPPVRSAPEPPAETAPAETAAAVRPPCAVCGQPLLLRRSRAVGVRAVPPRPAGPTTRDRRRGGRDRHTGRRGGHQQQINRHG